MVNSLTSAVSHNVLQLAESVLQTGSREVPWEMGGNKLKRNSGERKQRLYQIGHSMSGDVRKIQDMLWSLFLCRLLWRSRTDSFSRQNHLMQDVQLWQIQCVKMNRCPSWTTSRPQKVARTWSAEVFISPRNTDQRCTLDLSEHLDFRYGMWIRMDKRITWACNATQVVHIADQLVEAV